MIRYYFHMDPDSLSDQEWADTLRVLEIIREKEKDKSMATMAELFGK